MTDVCSIYSTHPSLEQARTTADALLTRGLAACCNLLPGVESHYIWEGSREHVTEVVMLSKTTVTQAEGAIAAIRHLHPYDCPAILQFPVNGGSADFLRWVEAQSSSFNK